MWLLLAIVVVAVGGLVPIGCNVTPVFTSNPLSWSSLISTSRCSTLRVTYEVFGPAKTAKTLTRTLFGHRLIACPCCGPPRRDDAARGQRRPWRRVTPTRSAGRIIVNGASDRASETRRERQPPPGVIRMSESRRTDVTAAPSPRLICRRFAVIVLPGWASPPCQSRR